MKTIAILTFFGIFILGASSAHGKCTVYNGTYVGTSQDSQDVVLTYIELDKKCKVLKLRHPVIPRNLSGEELEYDQFELMKLPFGVTVHGYGNALDMRADWVSGNRIIRVQGSMNGRVVLEWTFESRKDKKIIHTENIDFNGSEYSSKSLLTDIDKLSKK